MNWMIVLIVIAIVGVVLGPQLADDTGYLLIAIGRYTVETSLVTAVFLAIITYIILSSIERLLRRFFSIKKTTKLWLIKRNIRLSQKHIEQGMLALFAENYSKAEQLLVKGSRSSTTPTLGYLAAAVAAQYQGKIQQRDSYLQKAKNDQTTVTLTRARLQIKHKQYLQALASLTGLIQKHGLSNPVQIMLKTVYHALEDWENLVKLLPKLQQKKLLSNDNYKCLLITAYQGWFKYFIQQTDSAKLISLWHSLPRKHIQLVELKQVLCQTLITYGDHLEAQIIISKFIKKSPLPAFLPFIRQLRLTNSKPIVDQLLTLQSQYSDNQELLSSLALFMQQQGKIDQAKIYLQQALKFKDNIEDHATLANLLALQGKKAQAITHYQRAIKALQTSSCSKKVIS